MILVFVTDMADIYRLTKEDLLAIDRFADISAQKLIDAIGRQREIRHSLGSYLALVFVMWDLRQPLIWRSSFTNLITLAQQAWPIYSS